MEPGHQVQVSHAGGAASKVEMRALSLRAMAVMKVTILVVCGMIEADEFAHP
jgi:hypothetical protein